MRYPSAEGRWQVSTDGGYGPVWSANGRELFYRNGSKMMAVTVQTGSEFSAGKPNVLFQGRFEDYKPVQPRLRRHAGRTEVRDGPTGRVGGAGEGVRDRELGGGTEGARGRNAEVDGRERALARSACVREERTPAHWRALRESAAYLAGCEGLLHPKTAAEGPSAALGAGSKDRATWKRPPRRTRRAHKGESGSSSVVACSLRLRPQERTPARSRCPGAWDSSRQTSTALPLDFVRYGGLRSG